MDKPKKIAIIVSVVLLVLCLCVAVALASDRHTNDHCEGVEVVMTSSAGHLLTKDEVVRFISQRHLDPTGQLCDSIDLARIERELATMPLVDNAECCILENGIMQVTVSQRCPLFHVKTEVSDYCIDALGRQMLTPPHLPDTIISVSGDVTIAFATETLYPLVCFLYRDKSLSSEFRRISVGRGNQISLYSKHYGYTVILANDGRYQQCFEKLARFRNWDKSGEYQVKYKSINLQYRGQLVCKRK